MEKDLEQRTKRFGLAVIKFCSSLPRTWLELLIESPIAKEQALSLHQEATELLAIFTSIGKKLKE
jgi:hypothetical protein